jgi:hypothetical protein
MDLKTRHRLPVQRDGRAELAELAATLSEEADRLQRRLRPEPATAGDDVAPAVVVRRRSTARVLGFGSLALASLLVAALTVAVARSSSTPSSPPPVHHPAPVVVVAGDPASWGAAAGQRLGQGGRPVDIFGCQGAYAADAPRSGGTLPVPGPGTPAYQRYLTACLSDMSGDAAAPIGLVITD